MQKVLYIAFLFLALSAPAYAADQCYSPSELEAEHLLRLHSELMVITVTCHQGSEGQNLVPAYTGFTQKHLAVLHKAEQTLMHFFHIHSGGNGEEKLDTLRTRLGNEYGQVIADISAPAFCDKYRDKVLTFYDADSVQLQNEVKRMVKEEKSYGHLCTAPSSHIAKDSQ